MVFAWDEAAVATLKKLYRKGLTGTQIAIELGGITRNAVIGKIKRMGLRYQAYAEGYRKPPNKRGHHPGGPPGPRKLTGYYNPPERETPYFPPEPGEPPTMARCTLLQLT